MSVDTSLDWLAHHPVPTTIGLLALAVAVGSGWYYTATDGLYGIGTMPENFLLAATVVLVFGAFQLGMYVQYRRG